WAFIVFLFAVDSLVAAWRRGGGDFPGMIREAWTSLCAGRGERLLLAAWLAMSLLVYSLIPSKRYYYGLALAPPVAALAALAMRDWRPAIAAAARAALAHPR